MHLSSVLAVSTDLEDYKRSSAAWGEFGYDVHRVDTIREAITLISRGEKYLFIGINEDTTDFWGQLPIMRDITDMAIYIITSTTAPKRKREH
jgi:hypothetical protein